MNVNLVDASKEFVKALEGVTHPEEKRKIIGAEFVEVSNREAEKLELEDWLLAQGTIYPDTIESGGTKHADLIKTHHNRVEIIQQMIKEGRIVEPIKDLYKTEVRELGKVLGLPEDLVKRHPFPGPGLGVRVLCGDGKPEDVSVVQGEVNLRIGDNMEGRVLPIMTVGVKGDNRSYEHPLIVVPKGEAVTMAMVKRIGVGLCNGIKGLNRVVMLLSPEEAGELRVVEGYMTNERLERVREADFIIMQALKDHGIYDDIWQCPTILLPININNGELIVIRPIHSERAMTAEAATPKPEFIDDVKEKVLKIPGVGGFGIDLTNKPPGTIEWE
jgi:GMP synthase (glutamine-hydrolysing)